MILLVVLAVVIAAFGLVVLVGAPYVPSRRKDVDTAFKRLYRLTENDLVFDIGSGDGIVLRQASKRGARAVGVEINPFLVMISRLLSLGDEKVVVRQGNLWRQPFPPDTTVVYVFGESRDIKRMASLIQSESNRLGHSLKVISYGFELPGRTALKKRGAHFLYDVTPLQPHQA
jgi:SAM-dependent methyltransferase